MSQTKRLFEECCCKDVPEPTIEEIVKLKLNPERGFYLEFRNGLIHAGRDGSSWNEEQVKKFRDGY